MSAGAVAVELGSARLRAIAAVPARHGIQVVRTLVSDVPADLDRSSDEAVGRWIGESLRQAGFRRDKCMVALPREDAVLKRLTHPTSDRHELPDMTRLAMERDLPFPSEDAIIDFVVLESGENSTTVLAAALPGETLARTRRIMGEAGLSVQGVSLRACGAATIAEAVGDRDSDVIAIDLIPGDGIEFTFARSGTVRFSRAARIQDSNEDEMVSAAIREAQRTWLSRQMDDDQAGIDAGVVLGPDGVVDRVAAKVGSLLKTPMELIESHPRIDAGKHRLDRHWSLAGLLLAQQTSADMIDFASPRQAPDPMAGRRKAAMYAGAGLLLVILAIWTIGNMSIRSLQGQVSSLEAYQSRLRPEFLRFTRDNYRLGHLDLWSSAEVDWLAHLGHLDSLRPVPTDLVLDEVSGSLKFDGVIRDRSKEWLAEWGLGLTLNGECRDRATADAFRERLVDNASYTTSSAGNDTGGGNRLPHGFTYRLASDIGNPIVVESETGVDP